MYIAIVVIAILIVFTILILSVVTTSKAYTIKHTVDPLQEENISDPSSDHQPRQKEQ
ncbi:YtzI protein [Cytobacillus gottheilii]|uniref:YtzI protein n=2 Tax=Bacillaceae TaxID=186817 RepID=A0A7V7UVL4_9BACI|nr:MULTISPECIES: YtzI protein [Bacillaceae]KAB2329031.1 YtzI protein [Bacillus mesophilum]QVY60799.1 YtzI protein [Cytobacillus gottheilii]